MIPIFLVPKNKTNSYNPFYNDFYIEYLITKRIFERKSSINDIYNYVVSLFDDGTIIDKKSLFYFLNVNFDYDENDILIISDIKRSYVENATKSIDKVYDDTVNVYERIKNIINFDKESEIEDQLIQCLNSVSFEEKLIDSILIRKHIVDYNKDYYEALYYNIMLFKDDYLSLIKNGLPGFYNDELNIDINIMFQKENIKLIMNTFLISDIKKLLQLTPETFLLVFLTDFKYILKRFELLDIKAYELFMNRTKAFILKQKNNYLTIIQERIIKNQTLQELGNKFSVSRERIRQIEKKLSLRIKNLYNSKENSFLINLYNLINEKDDLYIDINNYLLVFNDVNVRNIVFSYIKLSDSFDLKYDDYYKFLYNKKIATLDEIVLNEVKQFTEIIKIGDTEGYNYIQKKYLEDNYTLKKEKVYLKKGLSAAELYLRVIDDIFPDGFKINDEADYNKLMNECSSVYGFTEGTSIRYIASILDRSNDYYQNDRGKFINKKKLPIIPRPLLNDIKEYIIESEYVVYYSEILSKYNQALENIGIKNQYMLKGVLDSTLSGRFKTARDYISYGNKESVWDATISKMRNYSGIFNIDDIRIDFPYISNTILQGIIANEINNHGLIYLYNKNYIYAKNTNLDLFQEKIKNKIIELFNNTENEYLTASKIYAKIALSNDNFLNDISFHVDSMNMYSIIKYLLPDEYLYRRPLIVKLDSDLKNTFVVVSKYLNELDSFDDQILLKYLNKNGIGSGWYVNYNQLCEYMADSFVRTDKKQMIKKDIINIDAYIINRINQALINLFMRYNEINITKFKAYFIFPIIENYSWNEYLLIGVINSYLCDKYKVFRKDGDNIVRRIEDEL